MEFEKCYVYQASDARPAKRRRVEHSGLQASWPLRRDAYCRAWPPLQNAIRSTLTKVNEGTVKELSAFLDHGARHAGSSKIPTAFVVKGPNASSSDASLLHKALEAKTRSTSRSFALMSSNDCNNLKSALKFIMQKATTENKGVDEDEDELAAGTSGPRLLNYDLQILANHVKERRLTQVAIGILDTEAFDSHLLSELIELLGCWCDRIPFVLLFNVGTSVEFLHQRLSKEACKYLSGRLFDVVAPADELEHVFETAIDSNPPLWIGPNLMSMLLERQGDYIQSIDTFLDSLQYAFMSCYYANALSIFLDNPLSFQQIPADHFEAVRHLTSFQDFCRRLLENKELTRLKDVLDSDEALFGLIRTETVSGRQALSDITTAVDVVRQIQKCLNPEQVTPRSKLCTQALSGKLRSSTTLRGLLLAIRKSPSSTAAVLVNGLVTSEAHDVVRSQCKQIQQDLTRLLSQQSDSEQPLRSEEDIKNSTLRTTVVAQKVELSKQKSALSKQDAVYTAILRRLTDALEAYFEQTLVDPTSLVFHEIFFYDLKSPHREVFTPRPRHAIERALATPHDYLDCACCGSAKAEGQNGESTLAPSQPATALLHQLYLESGTLINVSDLWQAFKAITGVGATADDDGEEDPKTVALFQRGLAELRYLGFMKATRRRVDHVAKVAWSGL